MIMAVRAFISCRFPVESAVRHIADLLRPEIEPYISEEAKYGSLPQRLKEKIAENDCFLGVISEGGTSEFIQNEVGMAFAMNKPVFAIYEQSVDVTGIQRYLSTSIKYDKADLGAIAKALASLKSEIKDTVSKREISTPEELQEELLRLGVQGIYPDRASGFRVFSRMWDRERDVQIVGSSIDGFKTNIGIDAGQLILGKLQRSSEATVKILLTHPSFAKYREAQEGQRRGSIFGQIVNNSAVLANIQASVPRGSERLQWKFFKGAPTCFMIIAGEYMLLNPYLYMQPAHFNFSMIVRQTQEYYGIFNHYKSDHFQRAWEHPALAAAPVPIPRRSAKRGTSGRRALSQAAATVLARGTRGDARIPENPKRRSRPE
jgi:hypothetical protein